MDMFRGWGMSELSVTMGASLNDFPEDYLNYKSMVSNMYKSTAFSIQQTAMFIYISAL